jgi:hypothetical protein
MMDGGWGEEAEVGAVATMVKEEVAAGSVAAGKEEDNNEEEGAGEGSLLKSSQWIQPGHHNGL